MSTSTYHHGNLREALVDAAVTVVRESGPEGLALRDLARRVGVSHNAAYRHFAGRDDLTTEVAGRVMQQIVETMTRRQDAVDEDDPVLRARRRLAETGRAYVDFAAAEPGLFRLAFAVATTPGAPTLPAHLDPYLALGRVLDELVDVGFLSVEGRVNAEVICWSGMHGFCVLDREDSLRERTADDRRTALERLLVAIDRSFGATTGSPTAPGDL